MSRPRQPQRAAARGTPPIGRFSGVLKAGKRRSPPRVRRAASDAGALEAVVVGGGRPGTWRKSRPVGRSAAGRPRVWALNRDIRGWEPSAVSLPNSRVRPARSVRPRARRVPAASTRRSPAAFHRGWEPGTRKQRFLSRGPIVDRPPRRSMIFKGVQPASSRSGALPKPSAGRFRPSGDSRSPSQGAVVVVRVSALVVCLMVYSRARRASPRSGRPARAGARSARPVRPATRPGRALRAGSARRRSRSRGSSARPNRDAAWGR